MKRGRRDCKKGKKQTSDIIHYELWQNYTTMKHAPVNSESIKKKRKGKALVAQLRFHQTLLKQIVKDKAILNVTSKGKPKVYQLNS